MSRLRHSTILCTIFRVIGMACLLLALAACSALKLSYNNATGFASWWLDGYFDFTAAQKEQLRPQLEAVHAWHRQQELPAYIALLDEMQALATGNITPDRVCAVGAEMLPRIAALNQQLEPVVVAMAPGLSTGQIDHLRHSLDDSNEEWREEWMDGSAQERADYCVKQAVERAEGFYGDLTASQVDLIRAHIAMSSFDPAVSYGERLQRQQDMLQTLSLLRQGLPPALATAESHRFFLRLAEPPDAAYRGYLAKVIAESCASIADLHNSTSAAQRMQAAQKLQDYAADLRVLHQQRRHDR